MKRMLFGMGFLAATLGLMAEARVTAAPCTGSRTTFYSDSQCQHKVGTHTLPCFGGAYSTGKKGPYVTIVDDCCNSSCCETGLSYCVPW